MQIIYDLTTQVVAKTRSVVPDFYSTTLLQQRLQDGEERGNRRHEKMPGLLQYTGLINKYKIFDIIKSHHLVTY